MLCLDFQANFVLPPKLLVRLFIDLMVLSTNPVPVYKFGVPISCSMFYSLQNHLYSLEIKALPLSDLITFRTP